MNWIFDGTLQYLQDPQLWAANARETADAWVFVRINRLPFCSVEEVDPDELVYEMTSGGEYEGFFFAEKNNKSRQAHIGWIRIDETIWEFAKKNRRLKMLFCRTGKNYSENLLDLSPSASA